MVVQQVTACSRRQTRIAELARLAVAGTPLYELTEVAVDMLADETGLRPAVARHLLAAAAESTSDVEEELRPLLDMLTSVLTLAQRFEAVRALIDNMPDAIVRFNSDLRCLYANATAEQLFGLSVDQLRGLSLDALGLSHLHRAALELALRLTVRTQREQLLQVAMPAGGRDSMFEARLTPEATYAGEVRGILSVWRRLD